MKGSLALAGIPIFAGYYSKDIVLEAAWADHTWFGHFAYWMGIAAALMTAFYSWRLILMTFHGKSRASQDVQDHVHESPVVMLTPLMVLAVGAIFSGMVFYKPFVGGQGHYGGEHAEAHAVEPHAGEGDDHAELEASVSVEVQEFLEDMFWNGSIAVLPDNDTVTAAHNVPFWVKKMPLVVGLFGILMAYYCYLWNPTIVPRLVEGIRPLHTLFFNKWYFDQIYDVLFVKKTIKAGRGLWWSDKNIVDRFGPDGSAYASEKIAALMRRFQTGFIYHYAFVMMIAVVGLISWFVFKWTIGA